MIGRLPTSLRVDVRVVWIHLGTQLFGGGNESLLIHVGQAAQYESAGILEETLVHEAAHTSLDATHAAAPAWLAAQVGDGEFISTYARDFPDREDIAESFLPYLAVRYRSDRISQSLADTITNTIPNRIAYFDEQSFDTYPIPPPPPECGNGLLEGAEQCDDGNLEDGDCCSSTCQDEPPATTCETTWEKATLLIHEGRPGREKLVATLRRGPPHLPSDFGNPLTGSTSYAMCIYDDADTLVGRLAVDRAGDTCVARDCWRHLGDKGYLYRDRSASSDGVSLLKLKGGSAGQSLIKVRAANQDRKGQTAMPLGIAAALSDSTSARMQLHASSRLCFEAVTDNVKKNESGIFKATR